MKRSYGIRLLIALDQLGNTICCGDPDETISSRVGRAAVKGKRWALLLERAINTLFFFDPDHCRSSIERLDRH